MSEFVPYILTSEDESVLKEFRDPHCLAASWDATNSDWYQTEIMSRVDAFNKATGNDLRAEGYEEARNVYLHPALAQINTRYDVCSEIMIARGARIGANKEHFDWLSAQPGVRFTEIALPHKDRGSLAAFASANRHNVATACILPQHEGEPTSRYGFYADADQTKATRFTPQSLSLIDIGNIVHFGPQGVALNEIRNMFVAKFNAPFLSAW